MSGPFGVNLDAAVSEINAKHQGAVDAPEAPDTAPDTSGGDLAPDVPLEGDSAPAESQAGESKTEATAVPKENDGTEFGVTPDGKINLFGKQYSPTELTLALEKLEQIEAKQAEFQKFNEHFQADLPALKQKPWLVHEMERAGYPAGFVKRAMAELRAEGIQIPPKGQGPAAQSGEPTAEARRQLSLEDLPKELIEKIEAAYGYSQEHKAQSFADSIGKIYDSMAQKAKVDPELHRKAVKLADAELSALSSKGHSILDDNRRLREDIVRRVYQTAHRSLQAQIDKRVRSVVTAQKKANSSVRDNGNGGVVPTRPAEQPKTLKDARQAWLKEIGG